MSGAMDQGESDSVRGTAATPVNLETKVKEMVKQPRLDHQIRLYQHLHVMGMVTLILLLALHLAHVLQILLDVGVKVILPMQSIHELTGI